MSANSKRRRRQSKPNRPQNPPLPEPVEEELSSSEWEPAGDFADVEDYEVAQTDERQLRLLMRDWRRGRATRSLWDMVTDSYVALFSVVMILAMVVSGIMSIQQSSAGCGTEACTTSRGLLPWLMTAAVATTTVSLCRIFGPVTASAAEGFWLLDAPIRRSRVLNRRLWTVVALAFTGGAAVSALVLLLSGLAWYAVVLWALGAGGLAAGIVGLCAQEQAADRMVFVRVVQSFWIIVATATLLAMIAVSAGWLNLPLDLAHTEFAGWIVLGIGITGAVGGALAGRIHLGGVGRARLVSGGDLLSGLQGAAFALDFALMRDILVERRWMEHGNVTPERGRAVGTAAIVSREIRKLRRSPGRLVTLGLSIIVPYALLSIGLGNLTPALAGLVLVFVMIPLFDSMRVVNRTKGLARCFPMSASELNTALTTLPGALAIGWALLVTPGFVLLGSHPMGPIGAAQGFVTAMAGYVGAIRWVSARPADYSMPMVATGMGAMPPGLMFNMFRGIDMVAIITLPLIIGWSPLISVAIAVIAYLVLRSGQLNLNAEELMERNLEARQELAALRSQSSGKQKITYTRTRR
ncbi:hypothetical protein HMPREF1531_00259 [Propionibacterium sp. oral taxon 192 str. F0372]|uniref:DUF6297 family protein n=1 Tax=Propionibacterium sp. oral taxon 192 TaxID=671222 RepID=UPI0003535EE4|nr:DUF6297 family protein [Propionibacterium sp. oral taxon 192]EPH07206.1 hypothetical protein HMPREF1531_00259 [Propionibacterium sp. oral taxon 192 str. F0372]